MEFRSNEWNLEHIGEHGIASEDAAFVVEHARQPFPRYDGAGKYRVWGQSIDGYYLQVIFVYDGPGRVYVIHARPLDGREKRLYRRSRR